MVQFTIKTDEVMTSDVLIRLTYPDQWQDGVEFLGAPHAVIIPQGQNSVVVLFQLLLDGIYQFQPQDFKITLSGSEIVTQEIIFQKNNQDPFPILSGVATPTEEGKTATITMELDRPADEPISFNYVLTPGTAIVGDYTPTGNVLTFPKGITQKTIAIDLETNGLCEMTKSFYVDFAMPYPSPQSPLQITQDILENSPITYTLANASILEGTTGMVQISSVACPFDRTIKVKTSDNTAIEGVNYTPLDLLNSFTFHAGQTTDNIPVDTLSDLINGPDQDFYIKLIEVSHGQVLEDPTETAIVTITENDPPPTLSWTLSASSLNRSIVTATVDWSLSQVSRYTITADVTPSGPAIEDTDFSFTTNTITIPPGSSQGSFSFQLKPTAAYGPSVNLTLSLSNFTHATAGALTSHVLTILDTVPTISITSPATMIEGNSSNFTIYLSRPSIYEIRVDYTTQNDTAIAGTHYDAKSGTLVFNPYETSKSITVDSIDNNDACESDRKFKVYLLNPIVGTLGSQSSVTKAIQDDDYPSVTLSDKSVYEGQSAFVLAQLSEVCQYDVSFYYQTQNGSAIAGSGKDYTAASGILKILAGTSTNSIMISTADDTIQQGNRDFTVQYSSANKVILPGSPTTVTILDDDGPPEMNFFESSGTVLDSSIATSVKVILDHGSTNTIKASLILGGSAIEGVHYNLKEDHVEISNKETVYYIYVLPIRGATPIEGKTVEITLDSPINSTLGANTTYTLSLIHDPNAAPLVLSTSDSSQLMFVSSTNSGSISMLSSGFPASSGGHLLSLNSGQSPDVLSYAWSGDEQNIIFIGNNYRPNSLDLISVKPDGSGEVQLNPSGWVDVRTVSEFKPMGNSNKVAYLADQSSGTARDLYSVKTDGTGLVNLVPGLTGGQSVFSFDVSSDGSRIVFISDKLILGQPELYSVKPDGTGLVRLNNNLSAGSYIEKFLITPNSANVVYTVKDSSGYSNLYATPIGSGGSALLSQAISFRTVKDFLISPDSSKVAYTHNFSSSTKYDLYVVKLSTVERKLINNTLPPNGRVEKIWFSPDSNKIIFIADGDTSSVLELYGASVDGTSLVKLNNTLISGGKVERALWSPDSSRVIYLAYEESTSSQEAYSVSPIGTGHAKINSALPAGGQVSMVFVSPDSSQVIYLADQNTYTQYKLFKTDLFGGSRQGLTNGLNLGERVNSFALLPNGLKILFRANIGDQTKYNWFSMDYDGNNRISLFTPP